MILMKIIWMENIVSALLHIPRGTFFRQLHNWVKPKKGWHRWKKHCQSDGSLPRGRRFSDIFVQLILNYVVLKCSFLGVWQTASNYTGHRSKLGPFKLKDFSPNFSSNRICPLAITRRSSEVPTFGIDPLTLDCISLIHYFRTNVPRTVWGVMEI